MAHVRKPDVIRQLVRASQRLCNEKMGKPALRELCGKWHARSKCVARVRDARTPTFLVNAAPQL